MNREYLEILLRNDGENWFIYTREWLIFWDRLNIDKMDIELIVHQDLNGFILIDDTHILFAFVSSIYRRKGILKDMMKIVKNKYNQKITLSSVDEDTDKVWESFGFQLIEKRKDPTYCSKYLLDNT